ncbi:feruloyl-CoA synthase [Desulfofundulus australicus DSM 11792]|uniref:Feruloyl-CoA synthase n=1 Tax=Desulfofundulus australicus DSM 11792 TaxID=1121425 RepID=A0A1M4YI01_9FIRM|nr:AMP-binding protein [Desulfofundulus australicus]SHF05288.1 feruloyl-CoA synthase [Desulfofundulus australicus DSM 11792]
MGELVHRLLERNASKYPRALAVRWPQGDVSLNWFQLNAEANSLARYLQARGFKPNDRAALLVSNRPEFMVAYFGILKAGGTVTPLNIKFTASEIAYILQDSEISVIIYEDNLRSVVEEATKGLPHVIAVSTREMSGLMEKYECHNLDLPLNPSSLAEILYTSGTTGKPKGVMLTHNAVTLVAIMMAYEADIYFGDRCLHLMPLTHSAPLNLILVGGTWAGATHVLGSFTPQALLELTDQEKTTHFFGAPVAYNLAAKLPNFSRYDLTSAKRWIYGGAPMPRAGLDTMMKLFPGGFMGVYGLTEAGPNGTALHPHEHPRFAGSIGCRGSVTAEIKVVNAGGQEVAPGEVGEIIIKTPSNMVGYLNRPRETAETLVNGWIYTGDLAERDEYGYIWIKDRKKDMIITGGVNVYPKEVEDVLSLCPGVADAAVVGIPHPDWGETVMAVVVPMPGHQLQPEEIRQFCRQHLADYKVPRIFQFTDVIPRNASGKILKHVIREKYSR